MHRILAYIAFTWLTLAGTLHFAIDVVAQYARGKRVPSPETTLYYGLNTAYALGQKPSSSKSRSVTGRCGSTRPSCRRSRRGPRLRGDALIPALHALEQAHELGRDLCGAPGYAQSLAGPASRRLPPRPFAAQAGTSRGA